MGWVLPPTFKVGQPLTHTELQRFSSDLTALESAPQMMSVTSAPLAGGVSPALNQPSLLWDVNYQSSVTDPLGHATFMFGSSFPTGVAIVLACPSDASINGLTINLIRGSTTQSGFSVTAYYSSGGNIVPCVNQDINVSWIAVGF
jgi:hypothetical protein